jgi:hypothetical protein
MDMIFTDKTDWQLYFRLLLRIDAWDWSRWLFSWIFEVYEKDGVKENRMNELGLLFWDLAMNRFKGYGKCMQSLFNGGMLTPALPGGSCLEIFKTIDIILF